MVITKSESKNFHAQIKSPAAITTGLLYLSLIFMLALNFPLQYLSQPEYDRSVRTQLLFCVGEFPTAFAEGFY